MIKGDMGKESFARAQGKYLYQCEVKASRRWCQAAGIFIVYKLLLLQLGFGRKGTKEGTVSQQESLSFDRTARADRSVKMQKFMGLFLKIASRVTISCLVMCSWLVLQEFFLCVFVGKKKNKPKADYQPPLRKVTSKSQIEI